MGMLVEGKWEDDADQIIRDGHFVRTDSAFSEPIPASVLKSIDDQEHRHVLIASLSCPWSHRVLLVRAVKHLTEKLPLIVAGGPRIEGYAVPSEAIRSGLALDNIDHLHQLYAISNSNYSGRVTVPVLWDRTERRIVSNESSVLMRALDRTGDCTVSLVPPELKSEIDSLNEHIHGKLANAVYRAGLAQKQSAYDEAVADVFDTLAMLEDRLAHQRYLFGATITESDLRLFATLVRFDSVYHTHFRCHRHRLTDYPNLWRYARDIYAMEGVQETVDFRVNQAGYYLNDGVQNPYNILPDLPVVDWNEPHGRDVFPA